MLAGQDDGRPKQERPIALVKYNDKLQLWQSARSVFVNYYVWENITLAIHRHYQLSLSIQGANCDIILVRQT